MKVSTLSLAGSDVPTGAVILCCASFEERSYSLVNALIERDDIKVVLFKNRESLQTTVEGRAVIKRAFGGRLREVEISKRDPLFTADVIASVLATLPSLQTVCIDISTFTREELFLIIRIVDDLSRYDRTSFFYVRSRAYSMGSKVGEEWLSRGVNDVRSVLGYPGDLTPGKPLHLVLLPGVEFDRAMRLCEEFEPNHVSVGVGVGNRAFDEETRKQVEIVSEKIERYNGSSSTFIFSTVDPIKTMKQILELAEAHSDYNHIVSAMSNKISAFGVGLAGICNRRIQLTYAEPIEYNEKNYSIPSEEFIVFRMQKEELLFQYF
jgi:hypothetical protein